MCTVRSWMKILPAFSSRICEMFVHFTNVLTCMHHIWLYGLSWKSTLPFFQTISHYLLNCIFSR